MPATPIVLVHGYSDQGASFRTWKEKLTQKFQASGRAVPEIYICNYITLNNEITIKDLAEGFERILRQCKDLAGDKPFDAIVHSTGMLVVRSWLATYAKRRSRLKHLIGLAPATFGSPLAHKGRSWLGAIFKGNREPGPDFLNAGDLILDGLELGSRLTWDLANIDLVGKETFYGKDSATPYAFIFCGNQAYTGLRGLVNEPGTDGTVRWSGVAMNSRKITLDLRRSPDVPKRLDADKWQELDIPLYPVEGVNHGTILTDPPAALVDLVAEALEVSDAVGFDAWTNKAQAQTAPALQKLPHWQQFLVRAVDDRGDSITDYNLEIVYNNKGLLNFIRPENALSVDVHAYGADKSLRCFHINLDDLREVLKSNASQVKIRIMASSGSSLVTYSASPLDEEAYKKDLESDEQGILDVEIDLSPILGDDLKLFWPFTTTLLELHLTREPTPLDRAKACPIFNLLKQDEQTTP